MEYDLERLIKEYFWFLVDEYGFTYKDFTFSSSVLQIQIEITTDGSWPILYFRRTEEPDYMTLPFGWIMHYLTGSNLSDQIDFYAKSLRENMEYFSMLLKEYGKKLFFEIDKWWIPAQKFRLKIWEEKYHVSPAPTFQKIYDYIKRKEGS